MKRLQELQRGIDDRLGEELLVQLSTATNQTAAFEVTIAMLQAALSAEPLKIMYSASSSRQHHLKVCFFFDSWLIDTLMVPEGLG